MFQFVHLSEGKRKHYTLFRKDLSKVLRYCIGLHLICCYLQIVSTLRNRLELVENLMQIMYIILISYVHLPVAYVSSSVLTFLKHFVFLFILFSACF